MPRRTSYPGSGESQSHKKVPLKPTAEKENKICLAHFFLSHFLISCLSWWFTEIWRSIANHAISHYACIHLSSQIPYCTCTCTYTTAKGQLQPSPRTSCYPFIDPRSLGYNLLYLQRLLCRWYTTSSREINLLSLSLALSAG